jgi:hypothetical protein
VVVGVPLPVECVVAVGEGAVVAVVVVSFRRCPARWLSFVAFFGHSGGATAAQLAGSRPLAAQTPRKRLAQLSRTWSATTGENDLFAAITCRSSFRVASAAPARQAEGRKAKPGVGESRGSAASQQPSIVRRATASTLQAVGGPAAGPGMRRQTIPRDPACCKQGGRHPTADSVNLFVDTGIGHPRPARVKATRRKLRVADSRPSFGVGERQLRACDAAITWLPFDGTPTSKGLRRPAPAQHGQARKTRTGSSA